MARPIRLNGRETGAIRAIGFGLGITGAELQERTQMEHDDIVDLLNTLLDIGYVETSRMLERVTPESYLTETYEVNPSYVAALKAALQR